MKLSKIFLVIIGVFICLNLAFVDFWLVKVYKKFVEFSSDKPMIIQDACGAVCQEQIAQKVKEEIAKIPSSETPKPSLLPSIEPAVGPKIVYVPVAAYGAVSSMDWTDIVPSEFYFDLKDYPGAKEVRFLAYILSINNDMGFARVYDNTNKRWAYFSDVQTNNSSFTRVESKPLELLKGNNKYTVQLRSVNATQVQLKDAKLKIIF